MRRLIVLKSKYSIDEQLKNLEDKNVQFNIMSKEEAREYLQNNTYYFKPELQAETGNKKIS